MSEMATAFLGAIIGGLFSLVGTWLTLRGRTDYFDNLALSKLRAKFGNISKPSKH